MHERIKSDYSAALDEAIDPDDAEERLRWVVSSLEREYPRRGLPGGGSALAARPFEVLASSAEAVPIVELAGALA